MKKITLSTNRDFSFGYKKDAEAVLNSAKEIAELYGYVTVADVCDLAGVVSIYAENLVGWSLEAIKKAYICRTRYAYELYLPQCDWEKDRYTKEAKDTEKPSTGEPINIAITVDKWYKKPEAIEQAISALFKDPEKIKDRPVFISIM